MKAEELSELAKNLKLMKLIDDRLVTISTEDGTYSTWILSSIVHNACGGGKPSKLMISPIDRFKMLIICGKCGNIMYSFVRSGKDYDVVYNITHSEL